jgi:hypothetical protein
MNRKTTHLNLNIDVGFWVGFFNWFGMVSPVSRIRFLSIHSATE